MARVSLTPRWRKLLAPSLLAFAVLSASTALSATTSLPSTSNVGNTFSVAAGCTQGVVALEPVADATVKLGTPDTNYGVDGTLEVAAAVGGHRRSLLRFELPTIEPGCLLLSAQMSLTVSAGDAARLLSAYQLAQAWDEGTVTWNNAPLPMPLFAPGVSSAGTTTIDVLTVVTAQYAAGVNHGMIIVDDLEITAALTPGSNTFFSRETVGSKPVLTLTFVNL